MTRKLKSYRYAVVAALLASSFSMAFAQDADQARSWAASCSNCHGTNGVSSPGRETLAGMPEEMMIKKMQDFKAYNYRDSLNYNQSLSFLKSYSIFNRLGFMFSIFNDL